MANPQSENGHVDIANEIMDALCRTLLSPYEWMVLMFIIRKTYGWKKRVDQIALSQFSEGTGIRVSHVCRAIFKLKTKNIITQTGNGKIASYCLQKDYDLWRALPKQVILPKQVMNITQTGNKSLPKQGDTKDTIQKTLLQKKADSVLEIEIPSSLNTPEFKQTWLEWIDSRRELKKPITSRSGKMQLKMLSGYSVSFAIKVLEKSIMNNWQGLFPDKVDGGSPSPRPAADYDPENTEDARKLREQAQRMLL